MTTLAEIKLSESVIAELIQIAGEADIIQDGDKVEKLSKDFYWYSPILKRKLEAKKADIAIRVASLEVLKDVIKVLVRERIPVVVRGGGTGNYGQAIPLHGGVVLDMSPMDKFEIVDGVLIAEAGARIGKIEPEARRLGWEMRCIPSTWVKSSIAGFLCGGSGGIGSITWGGIVSNDNVKSLTFITTEENPQVIKFEEKEAAVALHTYGTTGIVVGVEMRLAPAVDYEQMIFAHTDWDHLLSWTNGVARDGSIKKRLVSQFQTPIPQYFRPLKKYFVEGNHWSFLMVDREHVDKVKASAAEAGIECPYSLALPNPLKPPYLSDYTWNHTTLWAIKSDPSITYLQTGYTSDFAKQFKMLWEKFGDEIKFHLEWTAAWGDGGVNPNERLPSGDEVGVGGLPIIYFKSEERLQEIMDYCESIGVGVANPHTYILEEGGRDPRMDLKYQLKAKTDPCSLLNPGKLKGYQNPFTK